MLYPGLHQGWLVPAITSRWTNPYYDSGGLSEALANQ